MWFLIIRNYVKYMQDNAGFTEDLRALLLNIYIDLRSYKLTHECGSVNISNFLRYFIKYGM